MRSIETNKLYKSEKKSQKEEAKVKKKIEKSQTSSKGKMKLATKKKKVDIRSIRKKLQAGESLFLYEERYLFKWLVKDNDTLIRECTRERDGGKSGKCMCVTFMLRNCTTKKFGPQVVRETNMNACHWIPRGYYSHRWRLDNVRMGCVSCNDHNKNDHQQEYDRLMIDKYGYEWVKNEWDNKSMAKPSIEELFKINEELKKSLQMFIVINAQSNT